MLYIQCTTLSPACLCLQRLLMLIKEDLCRIFPVMISLRGLLYVMPLFHQKIKARSCLGPLIVHSRWKKKQKWAGILGRY